MPERPESRWGDGQLLAFSGLNGPVPYATNLVALTREGGEVGIEILLPDRARITFGAGAPDRAWLVSDAFLFIRGKTEVRGLLTDAHHILVFGASRLVSCLDGIQVEQRGDVMLLGVKARFDVKWLDQADRLRSTFDARLASLATPKGLGPLESAAYRKAVSIMKGQVYSPQGRIKHRWTTPDRWPHRDMWLWDSAFHAIGWRHLDPAVARDALSAVFDCQREDGFIPHQMNPSWNSAITQPPVLAYAVKLVNESEPCPGWVESLYSGLGRYLAWDVANRDTDKDGLLEWDIEADPQCRSGESGLDNSPRFDSAQKLDVTDFNTFLAVEYDCMAVLAQGLGRTDEAAKWSQAAGDIRQRINAKLWDPERGFYFDFDPGRNCRTNVWACTGFLPLLCGAPDKAMALRLTAHLGKGGIFDTPLPVASIPPGEPSCIPDMWRGPSWVNMGWLIAEGFARYGMMKEARALQSRWMTVMAREQDRYGTFFEYYDAQDAVPPTQLMRKGKVDFNHPHRVIRDYGWTATLYVDWCHRPGLNPRTMPEFTGG